MSNLSWNCRGLGNPRGIQFLKDIIIHKKPNFVFLCETLCIVVRIDQVKRLLDFDCCLSVDAIGHSGGLSMFWKSSQVGCLLSLGNNHIEMEVQLENHSVFRLTGFYGEPRRHL